MPRACVTGGSGRAGEYICCELLAHGWEVVNADREPPGWRGSGEYRASAAEYKQVDMEDLGQVVSVSAGCDAIIHMAAYPSPGPVTENVVFQTNVRAPPLDCRTGRPSPLPAAEHGLQDLPTVLLALTTVQ